MEWTALRREEPDYKNAVEILKQRKVGWIPKWEFCSYCGVVVLFTNMVIDVIRRPLQRRMNVSAAVSYLQQHNLKE